MCQSNDRIIDSRNDKICSKILLYGKVLNDIKSNSTEEDFSKIFVIVGQCMQKLDNYLDKENINKFDTIFYEIDLLKKTGDRIKNAINKNETQTLNQKVQVIDDFNRFYFKFNNIIN